MWVAPGPDPAPEPLASAGGRLRVLLDTGLLHRRRSGREVLHWWTDAGRSLARAGEAARPGDRGA